MRSCREIAQLISEGLDRRLTPRQRLAVRFHLLMCGACRVARRQVEALDRLLRLRFQREDPGGAELPQERRERIKRTLRRSR